MTCVISSDEAVHVMGDTLSILRPKFEAHSSVYIAQNDRDLARVDQYLNSRGSRGSSMAAAAAIGVLWWLLVAWYFIGGLFRLNLFPVHCPVGTGEVRAGDLVHIGILTHSRRPLAFLQDQYDFWISTFLRSEHSGGVHFVSEAVVNLSVIPTVIFTPREGTLARDQGGKRIKSLQYYLLNSTSGFFLYVNDDAFVWPRNLRYLFDEVANQNLTRNSHFIWGNCMANHDGTFLQGGGYFMSHYTAGRLYALSDEWLASIARSEDVAFRDLMTLAGLTSMADATSGFIIGQYIRWDQIRPMQTLDLAGLPKCPPAPGAAPGCRPFFARFNRIVVLHLLRGIPVWGRPPSIHDYPDNLSWHQPHEISEVCFRE
jgi:hypothetical protein